jgi:hypothetical protein
MYGTNTKPRSSGAEERKNEKDQTDLLDHLRGYRVHLRHDRRAVHPVRCGRHAVSRAIKRPRGGWGRRSLMDRFWDSVAGGMLWCVLICFIAAVFISMVGSTIKAVDDVIYYYENLETVEEYNDRREADFEAELSDTYIQQAPRRP